MIVFQSRKNLVTMENNVVTKKFKSENAMTIELNNLARLAEKNLAIPKVIGHFSDEIYLEYIDGKTFCELSDELTQTQVRSLCDFLDNFHKGMNCSRGDVNLKNFIFNDETQTCFSVDFEEELSSLNKEMDYGRVLAFMATYDPMFSANKEASCKAFLDVLKEKDIDIYKTKLEFCNEVVMMENRRKIKFEAEVVKKFWQKISK
ncbi:MAG: hypothetical protein RR458_01970 [Clostridia bacterium]